MGLLEILPHHGPKSVDMSDSMHKGKRAATCEVRRPSRIALPQGRRKEIIG
jgi:hypothetical protein